MWNQGSVIRSWLLELAEDAFSKSAGLTDITGYTEDSGEGRWTVQQAVETGVPAEVITLSLMRRFRSRQRDFFAEILYYCRTDFVDANSLTHLCHDESLPGKLALAGCSLSLTSGKCLNQKFALFINCMVIYKKKGADVDRTRPTV